MLQAGIVASPLPLGNALRERVRRLRGPAWALIPVASIVGVIFMIRYASGTANWLTYLALVAVPILAAAALGWASSWSWPWLAIAAVLGCPAKSFAVASASPPTVEMSFMLASVHGPGYLQSARASPVGLHRRRAATTSAVTASQRSSNA